MILSGKANKHIFLRAIALLAALCLLFCGLPTIAPSAQAASDGMIRVKLTRLGSPSGITFTTTCGYVLMLDNGYAVPSGTAVSVSASGSAMTISYNDVTFNCGSSVYFMRTQSGTTGVRFTSSGYSNLFCGDVRFIASGGAITTILNIYIEDYLYGVVAYEMSNSFPIEALKAQAVAARNYALRMKSARAGASYDVTDNTSNQVFKGYNSSYSNVIRAVKDTAGLVLYSGSSLAACYYTASNGGQTESTKNAWGNYLSYSVVKDDPYDLQSASAKKSTATINKNASGLNTSLLAALKSGAKTALSAKGGSTQDSDITITSINGITPTDSKYASPSRLYKTLLFDITASSVMGSGVQVSVDCTVSIATYGTFESWYGLSINSGSNETVCVDSTATAFTVTFRRYGHGIGMSQRGAQVMAATYGKSCSEILSFYYPNTTQTRLSLSDTSGNVSAGSALPTAVPSESPSAEPTESPTPEPSETPTTEPTASPTATVRPTLPIFGDPTGSATPDATATSAPTATPEISLPDFSTDPTDTPSPSATPEPMATPEPAPTAKPTLPIFGSAVPTAEPLATVSPSPTPEATDINQIMYVDVSASSTLTLRSAPSTDAAAVAYLTRGMQVYVRTRSGDWYYATTQNNQEGYVSAKYISEDVIATPAPTQAPSEKKRVITPIRDDCTAVDSGVTFCDASAVTTACVNVRAKNSTDSEKLGTLPAGVTVQVEAYDSTWAYISLRGRHGFVQHQYLQIVR